MGMVWIGFGKDYDGSFALYIRIQKTALLSVWMFSLTQLITSYRPVILSIRCFSGRLFYPNPEDSPLLSGG